MTVSAKMGVTPLAARLPLLLISSALAGLYCAFLYFELGPRLAGASVSALLQDPDTKGVLLAVHGCLMMVAVSAAVVKGSGAGVVTREASLEPLKRLFDEFLLEKQAEVEVLNSNTGTFAMLNCDALQSLGASGPAFADYLKSRGIRYCSQCRLLKQSRTHHCRQCGVCRPKLDHHCNWVQACVGARNYRAFLLLLAYTC